MFNPAYYSCFTNLTGRLSLYPVVAPVTLTIESIYEKVFVEIPLQVFPVDPNLLNRNVLV